jgi:hypothetical protein
MAWKDKITTTLLGSRLGLQTLSTVQSGGRTPAEFVVGAEAVRALNSTADTTAANLLAWGQSVLTTAASSGVYTLDPPIPGVTKTLVFNSSATSASPIYVKTANSETFASSVMSSGTVLSSSANAISTLVLTGISTAVWAVVNPFSTASIKLSTTT